MILIWPNTKPYCPCADIPWCHIPSVPTIHVLIGYKTSKQTSTAWVIMLVAESLRMSFVIHRCVSTLGLTISNNSVVLHSEPLVITILLFVEWITFVCCFVIAIMVNHCDWWIFIAVWQGKVPVLVITHAPNMVRCPNCDCVTNDHIVSKLFVNNPLVIENQLGINDWTGQLFALCLLVLLRMINSLTNTNNCMIVWLLEKSSTTVLSILVTIVNGKNVPNQTMISQWISCLQQLLKLLLAIWYSPLAIHDLCYEIISDIRTLTLNYSVLLG